MSKKILTLYEQCILDINNFINAHQNPTKDDFIQLAVNAKIIYNLFCSVKKLEAQTKEFATPFVSTALGFYIEVDGIDEDTAYLKLKAIIDNSIDNLNNKVNTDFIFPSIKVAFLMSKLIDFNKPI